MEKTEAFYKKLFEMARLDNDKEKIILSRINAEILDFDIISKFLDSDFPIYCDLARSLMFKIPASNLNYDKLLSFHKDNSTFYPLVEISRELLLINFHEKLNYVTLIEFQESDNEYVRNRAIELISTIPITVFDYSVLEEMSISDNPNVRDLVYELIAKAFPLDVPAQKLKEVDEYLSSCLS